MEFWNHRGFKLSVYYARGYWYVSMEKFTSEQRPYDATCPRTTAVLQNSLLSRDKLWFTQTSTSRDGSLHKRSLTKEYKEWVMVPQTKSSVLKSGQRIILEM